MMWLIVTALFVFIAAAVFSGIALVRRIRKKAYIVPWRISKGCFGVSVASLLISISDGEWTTAALFMSLVLLLSGIYQSVVWAVLKFRKKPTEKAGVKASVFFGTGLCVMILFIGGDLCTMLNLSAVLFFLGALGMLLVNVVRALMKRNRGLMWLSVPVCLATGILLMTAANYSWEHRLAKSAEAGELYEKPIQITYDFDVVDGDTPIEVVNSRCTELSNRQLLYIYDEADIHLALEDDFVTADRCIEAILASNQIAPEYKTYFCDFVERIEETYPGLNLAILYQNLKTLKVQELSSSAYLLESMSFDSYGCYNMRKNTIFIPEGTEYIEGEFGFQVLIHEFCHAVRSGVYKEDTTTSTFDFYSDSDNVLLMEAMNSVFSCSLLNYYEWDIAYQTPSNYLRIMLECMDNYRLEDYIRHRDTYFLSKLDEFTGNTNYAQVIWKLITLQRSDWEQDNLDIPPEEYEPIYEFLCEMYYGKYVTEDMTDEEKRKVADELVHKAFFDAPEHYKTNPDYFYEYLGL